MKPGTKITIVYAQSVVLGEALLDGRTIGFGVEARPAMKVDGSNYVAICDEGVTWLRGWYLPDSKQVSAARVAQALTLQPARAAPAMPGMPPLASAALSIGARVYASIIKESKKAQEASDYFMEGEKKP